MVFMLYRSCGEQILSTKKTSPRVGMSRTDRDAINKISISPKFMSKQPVRIRIQHPDF